MNKQTTIGKSFSASGVGLHSNSSAKITVNPAPPYTGYVFRRQDLNGFEIPASPDYVTHVSYATTLMKSGVMIATVEHLLSALLGCGVDNAIVEIDSLEVPILDGSSRPWVELIARAGVVELEAPRHYLRVLKRIEVRESNRRISIEPADVFRVTCEIDFDHPLIGLQQREVGFVNGTYAKEIAPARTFGFVDELQKLQQNGLARGGSLENAIALTGDGILNPEPLRFEDEFVRHKILDIIGDLALCGMPILGHVHAVRSGHGLHTMLLSTLLRDREAWEVFRSLEKPGTPQENNGSKPGRSGIGR
ncbi:MAG TPA: UDP-3-O-acyl-N-acetylglucosamine deacetylase [Blastocatellia bacterium]|nr:UDP-3-O-acyl-N-acetylglucosamine deacetylase [Blastocatellia bacterium]